MANSPLGSVCGKFYLDNSEAACIMGPVGSGKSTTAALRLQRHAYAQIPGPWGISRTRFAIVRETGPQLKNTTLKTWLKLFPESQYGKFETTKMTHRWRFALPQMKRVIDAEFMFFALEDTKDISNLLSLEVTGFWLNELREIDPELIAHIRARAGRYPGADLGGCTWRGIISDTNPWSFTSKYHDMFVLNKREGYEFFKQPGGMEPDAENLGNLEQTTETLKLPWNHPQRQEQGRTYYKTLLRDYAPEDAAMFVHCQYGASRAGKPVFVSYNDNTHCREFAFDQKAPLLIGYDCTGRSPAAVVAQKTTTGQWLVGYEFCEENMGMKQHAAELRRYIASELPGSTIARITVDPAGGAKDAHDLDMLQIIRREFPNTTVLKAQTNDPTTRIEAVDGTFRRMINGGPAVLLHPRCKILRAACISEYQYRQLKTAGRNRHAEVPDKTHPHGDAADALQYLMLGGGEGRANVGAPDAEGVPQSVWNQFAREGAARTQAQAGRVWSPFDPF